jgi:hypothetical protein
MRKSEKIKLPQPFFFRILSIDFKKVNGFLKGHRLN